MTMKAWLTGHEFDLSDLGELLPSGDVRVEREGDEYYLTSPEIDNPPEGMAFYDVAQQRTTKVNGLARVRNPSFQPVALSDKHSDGEGQHVVVRAARLESRARLTATASVTRPDGTIVPDAPSPWPARLAATATHPDLAEALEVMGKPKDLWWSDLYWVFEIIRDSVKPKQIHELGWATKTEVSSFTGSAQKARHARPSTVPPKELSLAEAKDFVNRLLLDWLSTLTA
jgi:hypothetical protein